MRTVEDFLREILATRRHPHPGYGGKVLPVAEIYSNITAQAEVAAYRGALEKLLSSDDAELKKFGVDICIGFFLFYDIIPRPKLKDRGHGDG
jgi:hypothetical protein